MPNKLEKKIRKTKEKKIKNNNKKNNDKESKEKIDFDKEIIIGMKQQKETKNKTKKINKVSKILKFISFIVLIFGLITFFMLSPLFNITEVRITGNEKITKEKIENLSEIKLGENIFKIRIKDIKRKIKNEPYVEDVKISKNLPDVLEIEVLERQATFMLEFVNAYVYINNQGYILEISTERLNIPIISGYKTPLESIEPGKRLCIEDLEILEDVIEIYVMAKNNELSELITKIDVKKKNDLKLVLDTEGKVVNFGDSSNINTKMQHIKTILEKEKDIKGEIIFNIKEDPIFREQV